MEGKKTNKRLEGMFEVEEYSPNTQTKERVDTPNTSTTQNTSKRKIRATKKANTKNTPAKNVQEGGLKSKISNIAALILGAASFGIAGFMYVNKSIAYNKALAAAQYNAQIVEAQKEAVETMHQNAIEALNTGSPLFDYNDYGSTIFPNMEGKFSKFAEANPELAQKIINRVHSHDNIDVLNQYAQDRGFDDYQAFANWSNESFAHLFNENGTISDTASMADIDKYYYTFVDMYNYLGDEAIGYYADEIVNAGVDPRVLTENPMYTDPFMESASNNLLSFDGVSDFANNMVSSLDASEMVGAVGIAALAGCGGYFIGKKVCDHFGNKSSEKSN